MPGRILTLAGAHPDCSGRDADVAAYGLHGEFLRQGREALFLAAGKVAANPHLGTHFSTRDGASETLLHCEGTGFNGAQNNPAWVIPAFRELLDWYQPAVVHFHDFAGLGLDFVRTARNCLPDAPIVFTLSDYAAICNHQGRMVKTDRSLCGKASPADCHMCMPEHAPVDYLMRELFVKSFFELVDAFLSSSRFLLGRYAEWGLRPEKLRYLEHGLPAAAENVPAATTLGRKLCRVACFGPADAFAGVEVLIEAVNRLPGDLQRDLSLDIYGEGPERLPEALRHRADAQRSDGLAAIRWLGPGPWREMGQRVAACDWVVVPSIWWENSPLVIEEAFLHRRPVICSGIGGMAERVRDGENGLHFGPGDATDLARCLARALSETGLAARLAGNIEPPRTLTGIARQHLALYGELLAARTAKRRAGAA